MKHTLQTIAVLLAVMVLFSGCANTQASRQAMNLLQGGEKEASASQWFLEHSAQAIPGLVRLLDSPREERVQAGQKGLILLGQEGADYISAHFHELTARQQQNAISVIASTVDRERIMQLLFLMSYPDARPTILETFSGMGQDAASVLISLLENPQLKAQVQDAFSALDSQVAAAALIPLLESTNATQAAQAQNMLLELGEGAASALVDYALHTDQLSDSIRSLLLQNPETTIAGIAAHTCDEEGCAATAAGLLNALGSDYIAQIYAALAQGSDQAAEVAAAYSQLIGVDAAMNAVLNSNITDSAVLSMVSGGFSDAASQEALAKFMLKNYEHPSIVSSCSTLLTDERTKQVFDALTGTSADALRTLLSTYSDEDLAWLAGFISTAAQTPSLSANIDGFLPGETDALFSKVLTCLAYVSDNHFSLVVLNELNSASPDLQRATINALLSACPDGSKFPYGVVDYTPYADSIAALISSEDAETSTLGQSLLKCIPETTENFAFFTRVFEKKPTQALFQQLSTSYTKTTDGIQITLDDGSIADISSVIIHIHPSWKIIPSQDQPDTARHLKEVLGYVGISTVSSDAPTLDVSFSCTPLSKSYPHMLSKSYTGSDVTYTMKLTTVDGKSKTISGQYTVQPPDTINPPAGSMAYLSDALDGPNQATIKAAYAQGLYKLFGLEALILMNQQNSSLLEPINKTIMPS